MANDDVGYGKPPPGFQFKPGTSGNPKGRPKRRAADVAAVVKETLNAPVQYREQGRSKTTTRTELGLMKLVEQAVKGDLKSAEHILTLRAQALRDGDAGVETIEVSDWIPEFPGQTAEQKTRSFAESHEVAASEWWHGAAPSSAKSIV
jgi:hypothetical protein